MSDVSVSHALNLVPLICIDARGSYWEVTVVGLNSWRGHKSLGRSRIISWSTNEN
jgi:hypothetical protein